MEVPLTPLSAIAPSKRPFPWVATALLCLFLVTIGAFSFKVFRFYRGIKDGTITEAAVYASSRPSASSAIAALAANARGSGALATSDDPMLGNPDAVFTIVEFGDFGCPFTKEESYVMRALAQQYPSTIRYIYRDFALEELHPGAELAAKAGYCAHNQGKFWEFHDEVFLQGDLSEEGMLAVADQAGLNVDELADCLNAPEALAEIEADLADGYEHGVRGTPTFFLNGEMVEGAIPYDIFVAIVTAFTS